MSKPPKVITIAIIGMMLAGLFSCQNFNAGSNTSPTKHPSLVYIETIQSFSTPLGVDDYPGQVTDGKLLFSITLVENKCFDTQRETVKIELNFKNMTNESLYLEDRFVIAINRIGAGGNLIPILTTGSGEFMSTPWDFEAVDFFNAPPEEYKIIMRNNEYKLTVDYIFPRNIVPSISEDHHNTVTPSPGDYFFRMIYVGVEGLNNTWTGRVGSNQIKICVVN